MSVAKGDRKESSSNLETAKMLKGLCVYTIQICKNEKNFPKRDRWILTAPIVKCAVKAYAKVLEANAITVVKAITIPCKTNNTYELPEWTKDTAYTVEDRFWLASRDEVGFGVERVAEGSVLAAYNGAGNTDRIKYDLSNGSTASYWWVRSPNPWGADGERYVYTDGSLNGSLAYSGLGAVAACVIM